MWGDSWRWSCTHGTKDIDIHTVYDTHEQTVCVARVAAVATLGFVVGTYSNIELLVHLTQTSRLQYDLQKDT